MSAQNVLIGGQWRPASSSKSFHADNPATAEPIAEEYPVSDWSDCDAALDAAAKAAEVIRAMSGEQIAKFLETYADRIESRKDQLVDAAHAETGLPKSPRLADVELPRTTGQLRQAAAAARNGGWAMPTIDTSANIRSCLEPIGPVAVFGPNNFPFAFGSISGGDFAAAIAAGNPVIAKANSSHPATTRVFGEAAQEAATECGMPPGAVQLLYRTSHEDGERLVADERIGATGYTGSRSAGLKLKAAAEAAGKQIYLELSSINPVFILPGALKERLNDVADQFTGSCLMGAGQFCTNPGVVVLIDNEDSKKLISAVAEKFQSAPAGTLLSQGVQRQLESSVASLRDSGAKVVVGGEPSSEPGCRYRNTLFTVSGSDFLQQPEAFQIEAFGNASLFVLAKDASEMEAVIGTLEGNLTGCFYSHTGGEDDELYDRLAPALRRRVGRLLNDKMPTGVAVSAAMNHGGPYPSTGHPGFTAVGIPASLRRFAMLACYDDVRPHRLPAILQDKNPIADLQRLVDGKWTTGNV